MFLFVDYTLCTGILHQRLWRYKVEEKFHLGISEHKLPCLGLCLGLCHVFDTCDVLMVAIYIYISSFMLICLYLMTAQCGVQDFIWLVTLPVRPGLLWILWKMNKLNWIEYRRFISRATSTVPDISIQVTGILFTFVMFNVKRNEFAHVGILPVNVVMNSTHTEAKVKLFS
jgi:hypothetical protein